MKHVYKWGVALTVLLLIALLIWMRCGVDQTDNRCLDGFEPFPLNRGYEPGSIVIISKEKKGFGKEVTSVDRLHINRTRLERELVRTSFLAMGKPNDIPVCVNDRTQDFKLLFQENTSAGNNLDGTAAAVYRNTKSATLNANKGHWYGLEDGAIALQGVLFHLPLNILQSLRRAIKKGDQLLFINEVLVYDSASLTVVLKDDLSENLTVDIFNWLGIEGNVAWTKDNDLQITYPEKSIVGYEGTLLDESHLIDIEEVIALRKAEGDLVVMYKDGDGDGFGSPDSEKSWVFGANVNPERVEAGKKIRYVSNQEDTYDTDGERMPGEQRWCRDADGDGYGDAGVVKIAKNRPVGYVNNDKDCYDNNQATFPGQPRYFTQQRGDGSYDYDCDGKIDVQHTATGGCVNSCKALRSGWLRPDHPAPGSAADYVVGCDNGHFPDYGCTVKTERRTQGAR